MPFRVDYAARFAFLREAAFEIVLRDGPAALSRRSIAEALGTTDATVRRALDPAASLAGLAADHVVERRRRAACRRPRDSRAHEVVDLLPCGSDDITTELVWWRLLSQTAPVPARPGELPLARRYAVAFGLPFSPGGDPREQPVAAADPIRADRLEQHIADRDREVSACLHRHHASEDVPWVRALVDGLSLATCLGRLPPEEARAAFGRATMARVNG